MNEQEQLLIIITKDGFFRNIYPSNNTIVELDLEHLQADILHYLHEQLGQTKFFELLQTLKDTYET